ncbi:MAG TPA: response regulator transcription factor [Terriglobales bacterium]|nr:response regulator transcription factor [Terriglobales bacterium]
MRRETKKRKLRIILADDHRLVRAGFASLLSGSALVEIVAEAGDGREVIDQIHRHKPDLVIMDIGMPNLNGIEAMVRIKKDSPETKILIVSMHSDEEYIVRALRGGASGYVLKDAAVAELELAVKSIAAGRTFLGPSISRNVVNNYLKGVGEGQSSLERLTQRQREILQLIAEGRNTKEIAFDLGLSAKTVETHRERLMERLNIHDVAGLVRYAIRYGLVSLPK